MVLEQEGKLIVLVETSPVIMSKVLIKTLSSSKITFDSCSCADMHFLVIKLNLVNMTRFKTQDKKIKEISFKKKRKMKQGSNKITD